MHSMVDNVVGPPLPIPVSELMVPARVGEPSRWYDPSPPGPRLRDRGRLLLATPASVGRDHHREDYASQQEPDNDSHRRQNEQEGDANDPGHDNQSPADPAEEAVGPVRHPAVDVRFLRPSWVVQHVDTVADCRHEAATEVGSCRDKATVGRLEPYQWVGDGIAIPVAPVLVVHHDPRGPATEPAKALHLAVHQPSMNDEGDADRRPDADEEEPEPYELQIVAGHRRCR